MVTMTWPRVRWLKATDAEGLRPVSRCEPCGAVRPAASGNLLAQSGGPGAALISFSFGLSLEGSGYTLKR